MGWSFSFFFFFKHKTAYEMRISDWSSDVCSSDLATRITDVLPQVERWTGFTQHFGHVSTGLPPGDEQAFLATLIAEATNLGLSRMAEVCGAGSRRALLRMHDRKSVV